MQTRIWIERALTGMGAIFVYLIDGCYRDEMTQRAIIIQYNDVDTTMNSFAGE